MKDIKNKIKITTLSPIHIGSGVFLHYNTDYYTYIDDDGYNMIGIVDENKVLDAIGNEHVNDWVYSIEREEDIKSFVNTYSPKTKPSDYSKRSIVNFYEKKLQIGNTLKECMHNGLGFPIIPGSSIKGAIRTCVFSSIMSKKNIHDITDIDRLQSFEKNILGQNPYVDIFRFLQVGDALFDKKSGIATMLVNLNIRSKSELKDFDKKQLVEAIDQSVEAETTIKLEINRNKYCNREQSDIKKLPEEMSSLKVLFKTINKQTKILVEEEIDFWSEVNQNKTGAETYTENMSQILEEINKCNDNECVLRLGHASGWRFMTGAWTEALDNFDNVIPNLARPKNNNYREYDFPKTRRLDVDDYILGFIKMSIL